MLEEDKKQSITDITDFVDECEGEESQRIGLMTPERVCKVDPAIPCSRRYEWTEGYGFRYKGLRWYCRYREDSST